MLSGLLRGLWGYLAIAVVAVVSVLTFGAVKKREGRELERNKHIDKVLKDADKARRARRDPDDSGVRKFDRTK